MELTINGMDKNFTHARIRVETNAKLNTCARLLGETVYDLVERLINAEMERIVRNPVEIEITPGQTLTLTLTPNIGPQHYNNQ